MAKRSAIITPFQMLALETHDKILNLPEIRGHLPTLNSQHLVYSSLIQAGLDEIVVQSGFKEHMPASDLILKRVNSSNLTYWKNSFTLVESALSGLVDENTKDKDIMNAITSLKFFLTDLLAALGDQNSVIMVIPFPKIEVLDAHLPPELFTPIKNLFSCFQHVKSTVATPRIDVLRDDIGRFQEVFSSTSFEYYVSQQSKLDNSDTEIQVASQAISSAAKKLCSKYKRSLVTEKIASILLPISSQTVDTVLGQLPGELAEQTCSAAENWITRKKRLSIYNLNPVMINMLTTRLTRGIQSKLSHENSRAQ